MIHPHIRRLRSAPARICVKALLMNPRSLIVHHHQEHSVQTSLGSPKFKKHQNSTSVFISSEHHPVPAPFYHTSFLNHHKTWVANSRQTTRGRYEELTTIALSCLFLSLAGYFPRLLLAVRFLELVSNTAFVPVTLGGAKQWPTVSGKLLGVEWRLAFKLRLLFLFSFNLLVSLI